MSAIVRSRRQIALAEAAQAGCGHQGALAARALPREHAREPGRLDADRHAHARRHVSRFLVLQTSADLAGICMCFVTLYVLLRDRFLKRERGMSNRRDECVFIWVLSVECCGRAGSGRGVL